MRLKKRRQLESKKVIYKIKEMVPGISNYAERNKMLGNCFKCVSRACYWISKIYTVYVQSLLLSSLTEHELQIAYMKNLRVATVQ